MKAWPVPGRDAALPVADARGQDEVTYAEYIVERGIALARPWFGSGHGVRYGVREWRRIGRGGRRRGTGCARLRRGTDAGRQAHHNAHCQRGGAWAADNHCCAAGGGDGGKGCEGGEGEAIRDASLSNTCCFTAAANS